MTGSIKDYTTNFQFIIPEFNIATWHDYIEQNFRSIDALFHNLFGINGFSGMWKTNSQYTAGQVLFVGEDNGSIYEGRLLKVVNDTNTGGFNTFSEAIEANPTDYELYADASSAQIFSELARDWANKTDGTVKTPEGDDTGEYSAKKYAQDSQSSATESEHFRLLAETDKNIALEAAVSAETSAQNSETSAQNALVSEQNSKTSETNAKTSEQNALVSEQNAKSSEDNAKVYETNAANSVETQTNNFNSYNNQLLSTTSTGVSELINTKTSNLIEISNELSNALNEIHDKTNVLDKTMITNCLTYIPQDINLELNNGTLTAKQGSMVWIPYGLTEAYQVGDVDAYGNTVVATSWDGSKFFYAIEIQSDVSLSSLNLNTGTKALIYYNPAEGNFGAMDRYISGTTAPTTTFTLWYDTNTNLVKKIEGTVGVTAYNCCFPLGVVTAGDNKTVASLDQIFNGFGYIGSTLFALPAIRGLVPNGRNADGSLKNIEFTLDTVSTMNYPAAGDEVIVSINKTGSIMGTAAYFIESETEPSGNYILWYKPSENIIRYKSTGSFSNITITLLIGKFSSTATRITYFNTKTTFQAVDRNELRQVELPTGSVIPFAANSAPNGYLICNGAAVNRTTYADLFAVIGTTYGSGDGSTTFNVPNLTDKFIQGSGTAGTSKAAGLPNITGSFIYEKNGYGDTGVSVGGAFSVSTGSGCAESGGPAGSGRNAKVSFSATKSNSIYGKSSTVQPPALTMRYYIKY